MNATADQARGTHPMVVVAAIAVTLFAITGIGAMLGWLPTSNGNTQPAAQTLAADPGSATGATLPGSSRASAGANLAGRDAGQSADPHPAATPAPARHTAKPVAAKPAARPDPAAKVAAHDPVRSVQTGTGTGAPVRSEPAQVAAAQVPPLPPVPDLQHTAPKAICQDCGMIESVRQIENKGEGSGAGAAAGGVLGGLLGHQMGNGRGRDIMTVVGAVGGALAGHQVEKNVRRTVSYEVVVRFEDGTSRTLQQPSLPPWHIGDRVRVVNNDILPNG